MIYRKIEGKGQDIVLLHGWTADHAYMAPVAELLFPNFRVTNMDLPGCGKSGWDPACKNIHEISDLLIPYLPKKTILIGWSFGGCVAVSIAARHPERVSRLIGICTTPRFTEGKDWPGVPYPGFHASYGKAKEMGLKAYMHAYFDSEFASFHPKPEPYHRLIRLLDTQPSMDLAIWMAGLKILDASDLRKEFSSIQCPIDFILGGLDSSVPLEIGEKLKTLNENCAIHSIPSAGHLPLWTNPEEFNQVLRGILRGCC